MSVVRDILWRAVAYEAACPLTKEEAMSTAIIITELTLSPTRGFRRAA